MLLTLTMPLQMWAFGFLMLFIGGKLLQQGGRMYGEGKSWMPDTIVGVACELILIFGTAMMLIEQNAY